MTVVTAQPRVTTHSLSGNSLSCWTRPPSQRDFATSHPISCVTLTQPYQGRVRMTLTYPALAQGPPDPLAGSRERQEGASGQAPRQRRRDPGGRRRGRGVAGDGRPRGDLRPGCRDRDAQAGKEADALDVGPIDRLAPSDEHRRHHLWGEQAVVDEAQESTPIEPPGQPGRPPDPDSRRSRPRRDSAGRRERTTAPIRRMVALNPNDSSSRGTGAWTAATGLDESAMTTKRSAAAATIFSRVWAAPPPLTNQPSGEIWSAPSMVRSNRSIPVKALHPQAHSRAARARFAGRGDTADVERPARQGGEEERHRRTGAEPHGHAVLDQIPQPPRRRPASPVRGSRPGGSRRTDCGALTTGIGADRLRI